MFQPIPPYFIRKITVNYYIFVARRTTTMREAQFTTKKVLDDQVSHRKRDNEVIEYDGD